jgi:Holliday junction resolvase RusA-like endonuclease
MQQENLVKMVALARRGALKLSISGGSFRLLIVAYGADPRSDWDNIGKLVSDALNGVFWEDDRQVIDARVMKLPCPKGSERTEVKVEPL